MPGLRWFSPEGEYDPGFHRANHTDACRYVRYLSIASFAHHLKRRLGILRHAVEPASSQTSA